MPLTSWLRPAASSSASTPSSARRVVAAVADEVEDVVVVVPQLRAATPERRRLEPVDRHARLARRARPATPRASPLLPTSNAGSVGRAADHRRGSAAAARPSAAAGRSEVEVADDRRPHRDRQERRVVVEVLPRHRISSGVLGERERDAHAAVLASHRRERRAIDVAHAAGEHAIRRGCRRRPRTSSRSGDSTRRTPPRGRLSLSTRFSSSTSLKCGVTTRRLTGRPGRTRGSRLPSPSARSGRAAPGTHRHGSPFCRPAQLT